MSRQIELQMLKRNRDAEEHMRKQNIVNSQAKHPAVPGAIAGGGNKEKRKEKKKIAKEKKRAAKLAAAQSNQTDEGTTNNQKEGTLTRAIMQSILDKKLNSVKAELAAAKVAAAQGPNAGKGGGQWNNNSWPKDNVTKQPCFLFQLQLCPCDKTGVNACRREHRNLVGDKEKSDFQKWRAENGNPAMPGKE